MLDPVGNEEFEALLGCLGLRDLDPVLEEILRVGAEEVEDIGERGKTREGASKRSAFTPGFTPSSGVAMNTSSPLMSHSSRK